MPKTKRVQVLMEPREFAQLEKVARKRGSSVSDLMREAARSQYLVDMDRSRKLQAVERLLSLADAPLPEWDIVKKELDARYDQAVR